MAQVLGRSLAEELETPAAEIGASATLVLGGKPTILLYDVVPGSALLSTQMMDDAVFRPVLARAVERTDGRCDCGPEGSCSSCLR